MNDLYGVTIILLGWFLSQHTFVVKATPTDRIPHILKHSKLAQLVIQHSETTPIIWYGIHVVYIPLWDTSSTTELTVS